MPDGAHCSLSGQSAEALRACGPMQSTQSCSKVEQQNTIAWVWHSAPAALYLLIQWQDSKSGFALVKLQSPSALLCPEKESKPAGEQLCAFCWDGAALSGPELRGGTSMDPPSTGLCLPDVPSKAGGRERAVSVSLVPPKPALWH